MKKGTEIKEIHMHVNTQSLEADAQKQFDDCCAEDFVIAAALMPDAHTGYVAPIGSVIKTRGAVVPSWVGYDIGCGMIAVNISNEEVHQNTIKEYARVLFDEINNTIPMGAGGHNHDNKIYCLDEMNKALKQLNDSVVSSPLLDEVNKRSIPNLGTLGSGNHFIEILEHQKETWLVIHSGSRGVGHYIGTHFMKAVSGLEKGFEATYAIYDDKMKKEYMHYQNYCLQFSLFNRMSMAAKVEAAILKITNIKYSTSKNLWTNKNHNHCIEIEKDIYLHRKGATSSGLNEYGVIPANMKDGCFLVRGLGNEDFLNSSSHGAGRVLSRSAAKKNITLDQFQESMIGIVAPVNLKTIDESPMAYKDIVEVMELQKASVEILKHLKPIINWKG